LCHRASLDQLAGAPGCFSGCARAVESELAIRVKFKNGAVSTEKNFAPAAWLARQMPASVIALEIERDAHAISR
jgi:hypothetical protein